MDARRIAVVAFDGISPFYLSIPSLVFGVPRSELGADPYDFRVCSAERGNIPTTGGFTISAPYSLDDVSAADIVIVPAWRDANERPPEELLSSLRCAHERGAMLVGLCLGVFVLAEAGVLNERRATTHWLWAETFSERFPRVTLERDSLYVDDGNVLTSAGGAAGIDCCLHLFRKQNGTDAANRLARRLVVQPNRSGGQAQFVERVLGD